MNAEPEPSPPSTQPISRAEAEAMGPEGRVEYLRHVRNVRRLTNPEISSLTGYALTTVEGWFCRPESPRHREIPARVVMAVSTALAAGLAPNK